MSLKDIKKLEDRVAKLIWITEEQDKFLKENCIHFSWWVRAKIEEEKKKKLGLKK